MIPKAHYLELQQASCDLMRKAGLVITEAEKDR